MKALITVLDNNIDTIKVLIQKFQLDWLILFEYKKNIKEQGHKNIENQDYKTKLDSFVKELPSKLRPKIDYIGLDGKDGGPYEFSANIASLFQYLMDKGYKVIVDFSKFSNIHALMLYINSLVYMDIIDSLIFVNPENNFKINYIWKYQSLNNSQKNVLKYLAQKYPDKITPTELQEMYFSQYTHGELPFISKVLKYLNNKGLVEVSKEGRIKRVTLSDFGFSIMGSINSKTYILKQLKLLPEGEDKQKKPIESDEITPIYKDMISDGFNELEKWKSFLSSVFLNKNDFLNAEELGFNKQDGIAYYLYKTLEELPDNTEISINDLVDKVSMRIEKSERAPSKINSSSIYQLNLFLNASKNNKNENISLLLKKNSLIKKLVEEKQLIIKQ
ncbi:MAG: hypothetical protein ACTSU2_00230 [Promethearchaeota archaeon]